MHQTQVRAALCALLLSCLAGCSGAPSSNDIRDALKKQIEQDQAQMHRVGGAAASVFKAMTPELVEARKIGCKDDGECAYRCDVELEMKQNGGIQKTPVSLRMVRTSEGWSVSR